MAVGDPMRSIPTPTRRRQEPKNMLVVMQSHATPEQIDQVLAAIRRMNLTPHPMPGPTRHGHRHHRQHQRRSIARSLEVLPGVDGAHPRHQAVQAGQPRDARGRHVRPTPRKTTIGPGTFTIIAGPCSVENEAMILRTAEFLLRPRRPPAARRCVQAAHQPVCLSGPGPRGARDPAPASATRPASASSPS